MTQAGFTTSYIIIHPDSMSFHEAVQMDDQDAMQWLWNQARLRDLEGLVTEVELQVEDEPVEPHMDNEIGWREHGYR